MSLFVILCVCENLECESNSKACLLPRSLYRLDICEHKLAMALLEFLYSLNFKINYK